VTPPYFSVKEAVFPFVKFPGVDTILGPEMKSTGEVMGVGKTFGEAFVKSQLGAGTKLPTSGKAFLTVKNSDKPRAVEVARQLVAHGLSSWWPPRARRPPSGRRRACVVNKVTEGRPHVVDMIKNNEIALVINTVEERRNAIADSRQIRTSALLARVTTFTTIAGAEAAVEGHEVHGQPGCDFGAGNARPTRVSLDARADNPNHAPPAGNVRRFLLRRRDTTMATIPITKRGAEKLKAELHELKTVQRPWVINAIAEARAQGDLSENAEYEAAKDRQGFIEGRIQEVEGKLSAAQIIDPAQVDAGGKVVFGATVELEEESTGDKVKLPDRGRRRSRPQAGPDQHLQPDRARTDRQGRGRHRRSAGARWRQALRDRGRPLHLTRPATMRDRLPVMLAALWWGSLTAVGFVVVPLLFAHLPTPAMAGAHGGPAVHGPNLGVRGLWRAAADGVARARRGRHCGLGQNGHALHRGWPAAGLAGGVCGGAAHRGAREPG
jgi:hypothetical protein